MSRDLFDAALAVMRNAHAPYSRFAVGAAIRAADGRVFAGCNVENASYPEGVCAETAAIAQMVSAGARQIREVALVAEKRPLITPCGGCRQRLSEFAGPATPVHLCDAAGVRETVRLGDLLPRGFDAEALS